MQRYGLHHFHPHSDTHTNYQLTIPVNDKCPRLGLGHNYRLIINGVADCLPWLDITVTSTVTIGIAKLGLYHSMM